MENLCLAVTDTFKANAVLTFFEKNKKTEDDLSPELRLTIWQPKCNIKLKEKQENQEERKKDREINKQNSIKHNSMRNKDI